MMSRSPKASVRLCQGLTLVDCPWMNENQRNAIRHRGHWLQQRRPQLLHRSCWRPLRSCRRQRFSQNLLPKWMSRSSLLFFPCPEIFCKCSKLSNLSNDFLVTSGGNPTFFFKKMGHSGLFFFYFRLFNTIQLTVDNKCSIKFCRCLESNRGPLIPEATALPTEPQPLPKKLLLFV